MQIETVKITNRFGDYDNIKITFDGEEEVYRLFGKLEFLKWLEDESIKERDAVANLAKFFSRLKANYREEFLDNGQVLRTSCINRDDLSETIGVLFGSIDLLKLLHMKRYRKETLGK